MASQRTPGPIGRTRVASRIDDGMSPRVATPPPGPVGKEASGPPDALRTGLEKVDRMILRGAQLGFVEASANLKHWREGTGKDRVMPAGLFLSAGFVMDHLREVHRPRFLQGARRRLASGELAPGRPAEMDWTDSLVAPYLSDLYFALGGFTLHSHVRVSVAPAGDGRHTLRFDSWQAEASDDYDWDPGKSTLIPGVGRDTDDEMEALERAGFGRAFRVRSETMTIGNPEVVGDATIP